MTPQKKIRVGAGFVAIWVLLGGAWLCDYFFGGTEFWKLASGELTVLLGIGAALHYNNPEDPQSVKMQELIAAKGLRQAVSEITSIPATDPVIEEIAAATAEVEKRIR